MEIGKIQSYNLQKDFSEFFSEISGNHWDYVTRVMHNQEQVVRCQLRDGTDTPNGVIKYWNMDGTEAAQFTVGSGGVPYTNILDMAWLNDEYKYVYITMDPNLVVSGTYSIYKCATDGAEPELMIDSITDSETADWSTSSANGYVGIACSDTEIHLKIGKNLYAIPEGQTGSWGSIAYRSGTDVFHYGDGSDCLNLMFQDLTASGTTTSGYVLYSWYDSAIDVLYLRSVDVASTPAYMEDRWTMLELDDYNTIQYPLFLNQLDYDALHVITADDSTVSGTTITGTVSYLEVYNVDADLAAFLNVNSSDTVMPAGIGATSTITARTLNCWGTSLSGKLIQFWVSSGDGGVSPTYAYTDADGRAEAEFTTGANTGISNVSVVVNEI